MYMHNLYSCWMCVSCGAQCTCFAGLPTTCTGASEPNAGGARPYEAVVALRRGTGWGQLRCSCMPGCVRGTSAAATASTEGLDGDELSDELSDELGVLRVLRVCWCWSHATEAARSSNDGADLNGVWSSKGGRVMDVGSDDESRCCGGEFRGGMRAREEEGTA